MFELTSIISWKEMLDKTKTEYATEEKIKHRVKKFIKTITPLVIQNANGSSSFAASMDSTNLFLVLIDFYFYYAKLKNVNPVVAIIETAVETNYLTYANLTTALNGNYKNTAGIKVNSNIIDSFNSLYSTNPSNENVLPTNYRSIPLNSSLDAADHVEWLYKKYGRFVDSIMAQIDRIALYASNCNEEDYYSHLSFDDNQYANLSFLAKGLNSPTIAGFFHDRNSDYAQIICEIINLILCDVRISGSNAFLNSAYYNGLALNYDPNETINYSTMNPNVFLAYFEAIQGMSQLNNELLKQTSISEIKKYLELIKENGLGMYRPRQSKPGPGNKYYIRTDNGGYSSAITGSPTDSDCDVLANCIGYANGRFNEICGNNNDFYLGFGFPNSFIENARQNHLTISDEPEVGACMVWKRKYDNPNSTAGHVAIVEEIVSDSSLRISESVYDGDIFRSKLFYKTNNTWDIYENSTLKHEFCGFIHNPAVNS